MKTIHIVPASKGGWNIKQGNKSGIIGHFNTKIPAVDAGRKVSIKINAELIIHGTDGKIQRRDSHGNDPRNIPG
jgi:hypothetical protein